MKKMLGLIVLFSVVIMGCKQKSDSIRIGLYDISKDDKQILFSLYSGTKISILSIEANGKNLKEIVKSNSDSNYYNPKFNKDGSKILFIGSKNGSTLGCSVFLANSDGSNKRKILDDKGEITEVIFSECEDKVYYIKSKEFGHSSPIGRNQPHDSDIYSIDLIDNKIDQITHIAAYNMYRLSEYNCSKIMLNMMNGDKAGLFIFPKKKPNELTSLNPKNNPRNDNSLYDSPQHSENFNKLGFIAPYELYLMDMDDKTAELVLYDDLMVDYFRFLNTKKQILYTNDKDACFYFVNYKGKRINQIDINKLVYQALSQ